MPDRLQIHFKAEGAERGRAQLTADGSEVSPATLGNEHLNLKLQLPSAPPLAREGQPRPSNP